jgi:hypothetical protein
LELLSDSSDESDDDVALTVEEERLQLQLVCHNSLMLVNTDMWDHVKRRRNSIEEEERHMEEGCCVPPSPPSRRAAMAFPLNYDDMA